MKFGWNLFWCFFWCGCVARLCGNLFEFLGIFLVNWVTDYFGDFLVGSLADYFGGYFACISAWLSVDFRNCWPIKKLLFIYLLRIVPSFSFHSSIHQQISSLPSLSTFSTDWFHRTSHIPKTSIYFLECCLLTPLFTFNFDSHCQIKRKTPIPRQNSTTE